MEEMRSFSDMTSGFGTSFDGIPQEAKKLVGMIDDVTRLLAIDEAKFIRLMTNPDTQKPISSDLRVAIPIMFILIAEALQLKGTDNLSENQQEELRGNLRAFTSLSFFMDDISRLSKSEDLVNVLKSYS